MKSMKRAFPGGAVLFSIMAAVILTPTAVADEAGKLSLAAVEPYSAEFDYSLSDETGASEKAGSWTDRVSLDEGLLSRTVTRYTTDGDIDLVRTVVVDQDSIAPVRIQQRFGPGLSNVYQLDFNERSLTQVLIGDATRPARVSTTALDAPVVETGLQAVFALSLPMSRSGEVQVKTYTAGAEPKVVTKTFHIVGQEKVPALDQVLDTWRIEDRASQWTYWLRHQKPYVVKVVHPVPGGKLATSLVKRFE